MTPEPMMETSTPSRGMLSGIEPAPAFDGPALALRIELVTPQGILVRDVEIDLRGFTHNLRRLEGRRVRREWGAAAPKLVQGVLEMSEVDLRGTLELLRAAAEGMYVALPPAERARMRRHYADPRKVAVLTLSPYQVECISADREAIEKAKHASVAASQLHLLTFGEIEGEG